MTSTYEKRRFMRSALQLPVNLDFGPEKTLHGQLNNLSIVGMYVLTADSVAERTPCEASFFGDPLKPIKARGQVLHKEANGIGIEFTGIDQSTFEHLRELILEHADDPFACDTQMIANMESFPPLY